MERREFLTSMLQGSLTAVLLPESIRSRLLTAYAQPYHFSDDPQHTSRITAIGIGQFGSCCTRLLAYAVPTVCCSNLTAHPDQLQDSGLHGLDTAMQPNNLLFLLADRSQPLSAAALTACMTTAAAVGVQTIVVGPWPVEDQLPSTGTNSLPLHCAVADPLTARNLVALVADLINTDSFVGIDHGDVKAILKSGRHGTVVSNEVSGPDRAASAAAVVLEQLQNQGFGPANCCGAMACIYGSPSMPFDDYHQAITMLDRYFSPDISFIFGSVVDEKLNGSIRLVILATR